MHLATLANRHTNAVSFKAAFSELTSPGDNSFVHLPLPDSDNNQHGLIVKQSQFHVRHDSTSAEPTPIMSKKQPASFESTLRDLEQIVSRLEAGDLPLENALSEFERGVQLARQGQAALQQAEQRVEILLANSDTEPLTPFQPDNK